jgi:prepilin-type N-terminal cleavage/methylation domain-containing protein
LKRLGFSLLETLVGMALLSTLLAVTFGLFQWGSRHSALAAMRQGLQSDAHRIFASVDGALFAAPRETLDVLQRSAGGRRRDALCAAALSDWADAALYDPVTGLPLWDRYVVFYATQADPLGSLLRLQLDPGTPCAQPYPAFPGTLLSEAVPSATPLISRVQLLASERVADFRLERGADTLRVSLRLQSGSVAPGPSRRTESLEIRHSVALQNELR